MGAELRAGIAIRKVYSDDVPRIPCYAAELNQVFMTILENSIDAIDGEGCISIQTSTSQDGLLAQAYSIVQRQPIPTPTRVPFVEKPTSNKLLTFP